jgi:hypothetical protein
MPLRRKKHKLVDKVYLKPVLFLILSSPFLFQTMSIPIYATNMVKPRGYLLVMLLTFLMQNVMAVAIVSVMALKSKSKYND